jgi:hypothetical protein
VTDFVDATGLIKPTAESCQATRITWAGIFEQVHLREFSYRMLRGTPLNIYPCLLFRILLNALSFNFCFLQEEIIDPGMDVHTITTSTSVESGRSRAGMTTYSDPDKVTGNKNCVKNIRPLPLTMSYHI